MTVSKVMCYRSKLDRYLFVDGQEMQKFAGMLIVYLIRGEGNLRLMGGRYVHFARGQCSVGQVHSDMNSLPSQVCQRPVSNFFTSQDSDISTGHIISRCP